MRRQRSQIPSVPPHQGRTFSIRAQARFWPPRHGLRCSSTRYPRRVSIGTRDKLASSWIVVPGAKGLSSASSIAVPTPCRCHEGQTYKRSSQTMLGPWSSTLATPTKRSPCHAPHDRWLRSRLAQSSASDEAQAARCASLQGAVRLVQDAGSAHRQGGWHVIVAQGHAANVTHGRGQRWGRGWRPCVLDSIPRPGLFRGTARRPL